MKLKSFDRSIAATLVLLFAFTVLAQQITPKKERQKPEDDEIVRLSTTLVQLDAVVTDRSGRIVPDLKAEDFQVYEDGKLQKITNFSFISLQPPASPSSPVAVAPTKPDKNAPPPPPITLRPDQVRRTIALVVDDLDLSFQSMATVRDALKKFVANQMEPGDLVAIVRTSGGIGAFQRFTADKNELNAIIDRLRYYALGNAGISAFEPIDDDQGTSAFTGAAPPNVADPTAGESLDQFRSDIFAVGTLGAVNFLVRGLRDMPGRKSIVLISDGITVQDSNNNLIRDRVFDAVHQLTDLANRASVVIYTMDARGLPTLSLSAADRVRPANAAGHLASRRQQYFDSQTGLSYLAEQTGGLFIHNNNDLAQGVKRVLNDQNGYYLIGYQPADSTFSGPNGKPKFHTWNVKVKGSGLNVRFRHGFIGVEDSALQPAGKGAAATADEEGARQLVSALYSPFSNGDLHLRLTSLFGNDQSAGTMMRSLLHVDAKELEFKDVTHKNEKDGSDEIWREAVIEVAAVTFGDGGSVIDQVDKSYTVRARGEAYEQMIKYGFTYSLDVPIKRPGAYQLRLALRDAGSSRVGSAGQFITVPDLSRNRLAISGLTVIGFVNKRVTTAEKTPAPTAPIPAGSAAPTPEINDSKIVKEVDPLAGPALRQFHGGDELDYAYQLYNPQLDPTTQKPRVTSQARLFRDGKAIYTGSVLPVNGSQLVDPKTLNVAGRLALGAAIAPGSYVLQILATDQLAKNRVVTQWIDFEVVK